MRIKGNLNVKQVKKQDSDKIYKKKGMRELAEQKDIKNTVNSEENIPDSNSGEETAECPADQAAGEEAAEIAGMEETDGENTEEDGAGEGDGETNNAENDGT